MSDEKSLDGVPEMPEAGKGAMIGRGALSRARGCVLLVKGARWLDGTKVEGTPGSRHHHRRDRRRREGHATLVDEAELRQLSSNIAQRALAALGQLPAHLRFKSASRRHPLIGV